MTSKSIQPRTAKFTPELVVANLDKTTSRLIDYQTVAQEAAEVHSHVYLDDREKDQFKLETGVHIINCEHAKRFEHPIQRAQANWAYEYLRQATAKHNRIIEVGANIKSAILYASSNCEHHKKLRKNQKGPYHFAQKIKSAEDYARYARDISALRSLGDQRAVNIITAHNSGYLDSDSHCCDGIENCTQKADVLIFHHSIYDITPEQFDTAMVRTGAYEAYISIHAPYEVVFKQDTLLPGLSYNVEREGKDIIYHLNSSGSKSYRHNEKNWHFWLTRFTWHGENFYYYKENIATLGQCWVMKVTRSPLKPGKFHTVIQPPPFLQNRVFFPDFYEMAISQKGFKIDQIKYDGSSIGKGKHLLSLPVTKASDMLANVMRQKTDTSNETAFQTLINQAKASNATLLIGDVILRERDTTVDLLLTRYCISLFVMGIIQRTQSSKSVGNLLERLKKEAGPIGQFNMKFHDWLDKLFGWLFSDNAFDRMNDQRYLIATQFQYINKISIRDNTQSIKVKELTIGVPINPLNIIGPKSSGWHDSGSHNPTIKNVTSFMYFLQHVKMIHQTSKKPRVLYLGCAPGFSLTKVPEYVTKHFIIKHMDPKDCEAKDHIKGIFVTESQCKHTHWQYCRQCLRSRLEVDYIYSDISLGGNPFEEYLLQKQLNALAICIKLRKLEKMPKNYRISTKGMIYRQSFAKPGSSEVRLIISPKLRHLDFTFGFLNEKMMTFNEFFRNEQTDEQTFDTMTSYWDKEEVEDQEVKKNEIDQDLISDQDDVEFEVTVTKEEIAEYRDMIRTEIEELDRQLTKNEITANAHKNLTRLKQIMLWHCEETMRSHKFNINFHNGIAGEGKSYKICEQYDAKTDIVICPSNKLKQSYQEKKLRVSTHEKAFETTISGVRRIFVDECCMLPKPWYAILTSLYPEAKIYAYGDTLQIGFVNRTKHLVEPVDWPHEFHCLTTRRCPKDSTKRRHLFGYPMATTTSSEEGETIIYENSNPIAWMKSNYDGVSPVICLYQEDKKNLLSFIEEEKVLTVHESQGMTTDEIYFVLIEKNAALHEKINYLNVADTRHKKKITIVTNGVFARTFWEEEGVKKEHHEETLFESLKEEQEFRNLTDLQNEADKLMENIDITKLGTAEEMEKFHSLAKRLDRIAKENNIILEPFQFAKIFDTKWHKEPKGVLVKPSMRLRSALAFKSTDGLGFGTNQRIDQRTDAPAVIEKNHKMSKHPGSETIESYNMQVVDRIEGNKFVENDGSGHVTINVPSSGDVIANEDCLIPTGGSLSFIDVDYKIPHDSPMNTTTNLHSNIEAINTITRDMNKQDYLQDVHKVKAYTIIGGKAENKIKVRPRAEEGEDVESSTQMGFMDFVGAASKQGSSSAETTSTFIGRMGKKVKEMTTSKKEEAIKILKKHIFTFIPTIDEIEAAEKWDDVCTRAMLDAYLRMDQKSKDVMSKAFDENTVIALEDYSVMGFNKNQWKSKTWYRIAEKVGQSVSQHSKTANMVMKFHVYVCDALLREYDGYKNFVYASGKPDEYFERKITEMMQNAEEELKFIMGDFEEFDSTQNELMPIICCWLLTYYTGIHHHLLSTYINRLGEWKITVPGLLEIIGKHQKHSGEAATLVFNTIWNTAWVSALFDCTNTSCALFKGDDSLIVAEKVKIRPEVAKLMKEVGLKLKLEESYLYGTFTDMIVTAKGATLDVGRRAQKVLSKSYKPTDPNAKQDLILSVRDIVEKRVVNMEGQRFVLENNSIVYGHELARNYLEALINISRGDLSGWKQDATAKIVFNKAEFHRVNATSDIIY